MNANEQQKHPHEPDYPLHFESPEDYFEWRSEWKNQLAIGIKRSRELKAIIRCKDSADSALSRAHHERRNHRAHMTDLYRERRASKAGALALFELQRKAA